jgi:hypothetical protein
MNTLLTAVSSARAWLASSSRSRWSRNSPEVAVLNFPPRQCSDAGCVARIDSDGTATIFTGKVELGRAC